jgi:hypothetical protein
MATVAQFRAAALALPDTVEGAHQGHADFRVKGKIFSGLHPDGKRGSLKLEATTRDRLGWEPAAGAWGRAGWTYVTLSQATIAELKNALAESHALVSAKSVTPRRRTRPSTAGPKRARI